MGRLRASAASATHRTSWSVPHLSLPLLSLPSLQVIKNAPAYFHQALVENTVMNHFRYYTDDATLACVVPPGANIPMAVADFNNLENVFRQGDADAVAARLDADDDDERAAGGAAMRRRIGELRRVGPPPPGALLAERRATPA